MYYGVWVVIYIDTKQLTNIYHSINVSTLIKLWECEKWLICRYTSLIYPYTYPNHFQSWQFVMIGNKFSTVRNSIMTESHDRILWRGILTCSMSSTRIRYPLQFLQSTTHQLVDADRRWCSYSMTAPIASSNRPSSVVYVEYRRLLHTTFFHAIAMD